MSGGSDETCPERLVSRQWSCSSFLSALGAMDASKLLAALPDDPAEIANLLQDLLRLLLLMCLVVLELTEYQLIT